MYLPAHFRQDDPETLMAAMEACGLATLVTGGAGLPEISHLPLVLVRGEGARGTLYGHVARANPHWKRLEGGDSVAVFTGADFYVSPSWYPSKREAGKAVPTWNYVAVHAFGPVTLVEDCERIVSLLTRRHEAGRAEPWAVADAPPDFLAAQLKAIVGFRMEIERLEGKWKMSQNRSEPDRAGVAEGLRRDGRDDLAGLV